MESVKKWGKNTSVWYVAPAVTKCALDVQKSRIAKSSVRGNIGPIINQSANLAGR